MIAINNYVFINISSCNKKDIAFTLNIKLAKFFTCLKKSSH